MADCVNGASMSFSKRQSIGDRDGVIESLELNTALTASEILLKESEQWRMNLDYIRRLTPEK